MASNSQHQSHPWSHETMAFFPSLIKKLCLEERWGWVKKPLVYNEDHLILDQAVHTKSSKQLNTNVRPPASASWYIATIASVPSQVTLHPHTLQTNSTSPRPQVETNCLSSWSPAGQLKLHFMYTWILPESNKITPTHLTYKRMSRRAKKK